MDSFMNFAKQGLDAYQGSQQPRSSQPGSVNKTGGHEFNAPNYSSDDSGPPQYDEQDIVGKATSHGSGDSSMFSSALAHINSNPDQHQEPIDENHAQEVHRQVYSEGSTDGLSSKSMGTAAAMQVMKKFTGGGGGGSGRPSSQSDFISLAMAEASKLFDKSGGATDGNKQDVVNSAGMTIVKLMVQSKFGGGAIGGGNSGGLGSVMGLASKFM